MQLQNCCAEDNDEFLLRVRFERKNLDEGLNTAHNHPILTRVHRPSVLLTRDSTAYALVFTRDGGGQQAVAKHTKFTRGPRGWSTTPPRIGITTPLRVIKPVQ